MLITNNRLFTNLNDKKNISDNKEQFSFKALHVDPDVLTMNTSLIEAIAKSAKNLRLLKVDEIYITNAYNNINIYLLNYFMKDKICAPIMQIVNIPLEKITSTRINSLVKKGLNELKNNDNTLRDKAEQTGEIVIKTDASDVLKKLPKVDDRFFNIFSPENIERMRLFYGEGKKAQENINAQISLFNAVK